MIPLTYMNSTAAIKASAASAAAWSAPRRTRARPSSGPLRAASAFCFCPISTWAATPATPWAFRWTRWRSGIRGPVQIAGRPDEGALAASRILLWKGHCAVHQRFLPSHVDQVRAKYPGIQVIVHPECRWEVCQKADALGSTERLIKIVEQAPAGSMFAVGTEIHLVNRMARRFAPRASASSRSTTPAACAPPCTASARSIWPGRWRTWSRAAW
jgi:quinolinate synthase